MPASLPNPSSPTDGDALLAAPIRQNFQAIITAINAFDGAQINAASVAEAALANGINPRLRGSELMYNTIVSGLNPAVPGSSLSVTIPSGIAYINGFRILYTSAAVTVAINQDTYLDMDQNGVVTSNPVANGAASPSLTAGRMRFAKIVSNGTVITAIFQGNQGNGTTRWLNTDTLGNIVYPTNTSGALQYSDYTVGNYTPTTGLTDIPNTTWTFIAQKAGWLDFGVNAASTINAAPAVARDMYINLDGTNLHSTDQTEYSNANSANALVLQGKIFVAAGSHTVKAQIISTNSSATLTNRSTAYKFTP